MKKKKHKGGHWGSNNGSLQKVEDKIAEPKDKPQGTQEAPPLRVLKDLGFEDIHGVSRAKQRPPPDRRGEVLSKEDQKTLDWVEQWKIGVHHLKSGLG